MSDSNAQAAAVAFSKQSSVFDQLEKDNGILQWMRKQVHDHCLQFFKTGDSILELNCGTGIDAIFFAEQGMHVHATDMSEGMLNELKKKIEMKNLQEKISVQQCSFTELTSILLSPTSFASAMLSVKKFDHIFSDFGGLNCEKNIEGVISQFKDLLKQGGTVTLVIMPPFCPWEISLLLKGNFKTAFRRFKRNGTASNVEGIHFNTFYFTPSRLIKAFGRDYQLLGLRGLACLIPPPYLENFPKRYPKIFGTLKRMDQKLNHTFPFNHWADHFIITVKRC
jgi:ubiquinone/menaquinone biosynthesis C-methylase UbiE